MSRIDALGSQLQSHYEVFLHQLDAHGCRLPATITQITSLTSLGLNDVSLTQLPQDIGQLANLRSLEVRENLIRSLPPSIVQLQRLQMLDLGQNELNELVSAEVLPLPPRLCCLLSKHERRANRALRGECCSRLA